MPEHRATLWRHPEFLKLWAAQAISAVGSQVTTLALPLTATLLLQASAIEMGLLHALNSVPSLLFGLAAGVCVDRLRRRPVVIAADVGRAVVLASIPLAWLLGVLRVEQLFLVALLASTLTVFFDVAHHSYLPTLVSDEQLADGNGKLEASRSLAMTAGPGLGGLLVQFLTAPMAILADALSYLVSAVLLVLIRADEPPPRRQKQAGGGFWSDLVEGLRAVANEPLLRSMAASLCLFNLFSSWVGAAYVLYVIGELEVAPAALGLIYAAGGVAFSVGALSAAAVARRFGVGPAIVWGAGISDAALLVVPLAGLWPAAAIPVLMLAQAVATLAGPVTAINQLSLRQALTADRLRGRVNATMRVIALGAGPLGAVAGGLLGEHFGLWPAVLVGAIGAQLGFVVLLLSPVRAIRDLPSATAGLAR
jgi:MFS family permease